MENKNTLILWKIADDTGQSEGTPIHYKAIKYIPSILDKIPFCVTNVYIFHFTVSLPVQYIRASAFAVEPSRKVNPSLEADLMPGTCFTFDGKYLRGSGKLWLI